MHAAPLRVVAAVVAALAGAAPVPAASPVFTAGAAGIANAVRPASSVFDACTPPAGERWTREPLLCLYSTARRENRLEEARARLRQLGAGQADHPWPTLVLAYATHEQDEPRAAALYELAATGFSRARDAEGEVLARHNLRNLYHQRGDAAAASREVARARAAAEASGQPLTIARAAVLEASDTIETGGDLGHAYRTLRRAERLAFPNGPIGLRRAILFSLATASLNLGRLDDAIDVLERHRALRQEDGSTADAAAVAFNLLAVRLTQSEARPRPGARARLTREAENVLAEAESLGRPALVARTHHVLADLLRTTDPDAAGLHLARCLAQTASSTDPETRARCLWSLSLQSATRDPRGAERASRDALAALATNPDGLLLVHAWQARLRLVWQTMPEAAAMVGSLEALDAIERLRARQQDDGARAALFGHWTRDYAWLTGRLLDARTPRVAAAFEVGERLRARVLLEQLARPRIGDSATAGDTAPDDVARRLRQQIVDTQGRLLSPALDRDGRRDLLDRLQLLELEEREANRPQSPVAAHALPPFASLDAVQQALAPDEALLWFAMAPWEDVYGDFGGGAWVLSVSRRAVTVHRLAGTGDLDSQVAALVGLLRDRETPAASWESAAARLGRALLGDAVGALSPDVSRLIIVSHGDLHRLPFEALRPAAGQPRLGERFEVTLVPSATVWLHLRSLARSQDPLPRANGALVFADPVVLPGSVGGDLQLAPLPWARKEARAISRTLDLDPRQVLEGSAASERALKDARLDRVAILHLAAHARADDAFPERSAVFLTPGSSQEDGWLQPREIAALDLRGRLVVLSACESADGLLLSGEGPLSLARAFFAGGARAVVATRWPLRDDDAAHVMSRFYEALGAGMGTAAALRQARQQAIAEGRPAAAWAGLVLLGDGAKPVLAPTPPRTVPWLAVTVAITLALAIAGAVAWLVRSRTAWRRAPADA